MSTMWDGRIRADARALPIANESVQCVVTSPPYWGLRDYGQEGQIGLEKTPDAYVESLREVFREVWRVLKVDGTAWLNLGDSYFGSWGNYGGQNRGNGTQREIVNGSQVPNPAYDELERFRPPTAYKHDTLKPKDLVGIPWRVAFALQADGWYLRSDIVWAKPNPMPESVTDRPTKAHEYIFLLTKSERYYYDAAAIRERFTDERFGNPGESIKRKVCNYRRDGGFIDEWTAGEERGGRNCRSVWTISTQPYPEAHYATFPEEIPEICIKAGTRPGDIVMDPFFGSGTVGRVAERLNRRWIGCDLGYQDLQAKRVSNVQKELTWMGL